MKRLFALITVLILAAHCGTSYSTPDAGGGPDSGPAGTYQLAINNYLAWCVVTVDSQPLNSNGTYTYDAGTVVDLHATGATGFTFAYWTNTDNNTSASTEVTMDANKNVLACCNNATEQCPTH